MTSLSASRPIAISCDSLMKASSRLPVTGLVAHAPISTAQATAVSTSRTFARKAMAAPPCLAILRRPDRQGQWELCAPPASACAWAPWPCTTAAIAST